MIKLSTTSDSAYWQLQKQGKHVGYRSQHKIKAAALESECEPHSQAAPRPKGYMSGKSRKTSILAKIITTTYVASTVLNALCKTSHLILMTMRQIVLLLLLYR